MTANGSSLRVGFIGLGDIGLPMAIRLHETGNRLRVWNRTASRSASCSALGIAVAETPAGLAAESDIICLCLSSADAVDAVVFGENGITSAATAPRIVVDHSTILPEDTRALCHRLTSATGTGWLDAPVSGGPPGARAGTLAIMVGGRPADFELAAPVLASLGGRITYLGRSGMGQLAKAANQVINFATAAAIGEAFALARAEGLSATILAEALTGGFSDSNMLREYRRAATAGESAGLKGLIDSYSDLATGHRHPEYPGKLDILHKDIAVATSIASANDIAIPLLRQVEALGRLIHDRRSASASATQRGPTI